MMGITTLRSLLLAAFVLSNVSWTTSRHHVRHNVNGHRSRHRRQDAGLFHPASYVIPGGEGTGAWGEWGKVSACSRTCGGGVANQKRICLEVGPDGQPLCEGGDTKYFSCQTQDCPENANDFRAEQCSEYDHQAFRGSGITYNWVPYTKALNPCELNCMPRGERFYYRQKPQVVDGTRCNDESFDVCVEGVCQPVGCDMMLGSNAREDKCRNCRGNGTNCYTVAGLLDTDDLRKGYNDMLLIPQGATNIFIEEVQESNNYLALRGKQNKVYYLNGDYHIDFPRSLTIAGTLWHYERSQQGLAAPDKLRCLGPTIEPLYLSLLLQDHNVGISYEYSMPSALAPPPNQQYNWVHESFSECSATCGGGFQVREVTCRSREELNIVDDVLCDDGLKPPTNQTCNIEACPPRWVEGPWSPCSRPCGDGGTRSRQVYCEKIITNRFPSIVADKECFDLLGPKPELYQKCNQNATCPTWFIGHWKPCDRLCGEGKQTRQVVCHQKIDGFVQLFEDAECEAEKPITAKTCLLHPCQGVDWVISDWSGCDTCLSMFRTRVAHCATEDHKVIDSDLCSHHPSPILKEPCDRTKLPPCQVQWYATQWSNCSVECGTGVRTRRVFCGLFDGASVIKVDDERCDEEYKYKDTTECVIPKEKCPAKWFAGPWSKCSEQCGGGEQNRSVMCLSGGKEVLQCDMETILESTQSCNDGPCDKDNLLPIDSKSSPIMDDYDEKDCVEEDEEYPEAAAEAYVTAVPTLFPDFYFPEASTTDSGISTETGSGFEWTDFSTDETYSTDVTESTESTYFSEVESTTETEITILTESSTTESTNSISTESIETSTSDSTSSSITEVTDSTTENNELSTKTSETESSTTENIDISTIFSTDSSTKDDDMSSTLLSSTMSDGESSITGSEFSTTETTESDLSSTTETELSSTTKDDESTVTENKLITTETTDSSTIVSTSSSEPDSSELSTTESALSSTIENGESSTTQNDVSSTTSDQISTSESALSSSTEINESSTTERDASSTVENVLSSTTENDETNLTETTESSTTDATSSISESSLSSTIENSKSSTTESVASSTTENAVSSTSESDVSSTSESDISSTKESIISSTTENTESSTTPSDISSTTENAISSTSESDISSKSESAVSSTTEITESIITTSDISSTTENAESSTTSSDISSTTVSDVSSTTASDISSTTASDISSTTASDISSTTAGDIYSTTAVDMSSTTASDISSTIESAVSSTSESAESSTTESDQSSTTENELSSTTTESFGSTTEPETLTTGGTTDSIIAESSTDISTESSTTDSDETGATESTETTETTESSTSSAGSTDASTSSEEQVTNESSTPKTTPWNWASTVELFNNNRNRCKPRKVAKCTKSKFGCCPDKKTPATGPFEKGCVYYKTCKDLDSGCCPDGVSPATGPQGRGCPVSPCNETLYGCCSDNVTAAEGNNQKGCPPPPPACKSSKYDCCDDNETEAKGPQKKGCPEKEIETEKPTTVLNEGCADTEFGCCFDNETDASGPNGEGCPCSISQFGCCPDGLTTAGGNKMEGCLMSCNTSAYGCCPDGETPAHGPQFEGCCLQHVFGCCPDNYRPAEGPHLEGCGCEYARFGCCTDNITLARGPNMEGCGCEHSRYGCCPDRHTEAKGPEFEGCECHTYQFGCCLDGVTIASGPELEGCRCEQSKYGCCGDETTTAKGPNMEGCDCSNSKYGCCPDGKTEAKGDKFLNCSDVPLNRQAACGLDNDKGTCRNYTVQWYYDMQYGGCSQFWYGGCEGNGNRFVTKEECEDVCVQPSPKDACNLPKVKATCDGYHVRWYYDSEREQCSQFVYGGCLGNANNFDTKELCQERCEPEKTEDQCNLSLERGPCAGNFARWGFSPERRVCEQFVWGGCGGNHNRYDSEAACQLRCAPPGQPQQACSQPQDAGNCTEKHPAWSFNQAENRCVPFYYSGCGGNDNRFKTEHSCDDSCPSAFVPEICTLPAMIGDCADYTQKWFFDTTKKRCRLFYYGGCGGNENNFFSESECENRCSEQPTTTTTAQPVPLQPQTEPAVSEFCLLDIDKGPCTQSLLRWAHDAASGACVQFEYGGCGGNRNNFPSLEYCQHYCGSTTTEQNVCQMPFVSGPCDQSIMQWFYDAASDSCNLFTYGGCGGNGNRFNSLADCERQCRVQTLPPATTTTPSTTTIAAETIPSACQVSRELEECVESGEVWFLDVEQHGCVSLHNEGPGPRCRHTGVFLSQEACERNCGAFRDLDVCRYSLDPGPCHESVSKVYFETATGRCEPFTYGGCHGGPNRFSTVEECEQICRPNADPCGQSPEPGNCLAYFLMWYYDSERDACNQFVYGGCNGNDNRFETQAECEVRCKKETTTTFIPTTASLTTTTTVTIAPSPTPQLMVDAECATPASLAPCGENITAYYFDTRTQACLVGDFGGCPYSNRYFTEEECQRSCGAFKGLDVCGSRLDPGPCLNTIPKFYWDPLSGRCLGFAYGGCHGGPNRFSTVDECEEICGATGPEARCLAPVSTGQPGCGTPSRRWYYSAGSGDCVAFVYSGCGGNDNNFHTYEECALCKRVSSPMSETETGNEVLPDCDAYNAECATLQCEYGVQRTRSRSGCERCTCVAPEVDCAQHAKDCLNLKCNYGMQRTVDNDGCERCNCIDHPCANKKCSSGERCVATPYRDAITQDILYSSDCRLANKSGSCPSNAAFESSTENRCRRQCNDDADCLGVGKCCERGCSQLCLEPAATTSPVPPVTSYVPELPQMPYADLATTPEVHASLGGTATLRCLFHGNPPPKITWQRGQITIDGDVGRYRLLSDGALEIVSLYRNDSGVYICLADNGLGVARQEINLEVDVPVTTRIVSERTRLTAGSELNLLCQVDGYPVPEVYWTKDSTAISSNDRITVTAMRLMVSRVNTNDTGVYGCHAFNEYNSHYSSVEISVEGLYIPPTCKDNPYFANCNLIVRSKFCYHKYYSNFCCKSCVEAGQLDVGRLERQTDDTLYRK